MKKIIALTILSAFMSPVSMAESQDECSIWLCLPAGFPSGCGDAKSAFKKRIKDFMPPLPPFTACAINYGAGSSNMTSNYNKAAYIPQHTICTKWVYKNTYGKDGYSQQICVQTKVIPESYVKNKTCNIYRQTKDGELTHSPEYCTKTVHYIDVYADGQKMGDTYYW